jgi:hemolysin activation/secretion protein
MLFCQRHHLRQLIRSRSLAPAALLCMVAAWAIGVPAGAQGAAAKPSPAPAASPAADTQAAAPQENMPQFYIREYRVTGAHAVKPEEIEEAVYPYLGPARTVKDIDGARAAIQKLYQDKNYTSVEVLVPQQTGAGGIVFLRVNELTVGRLRVHGSRFYDIEQIKRAVPSLAEGKLIDFAQAQKDLVGLNQLPDRRVTPVIQAGVVPGTMDVDLNVKDTLPLHGSVELNNRYSANTPPLRLNASVDYDNLWQLGHSIGGSLQISPQNESKVSVFTGFYTVRFPTVDWLSFTLQGTKQNSNVSTLGSIDVTGKGDIVGLRTTWKLPTMGDYFQNLTLGVDYKEFNQAVQVGLTGSTTTATQTPTTYVPITLDYSGTWVDKNALTDLDLQFVFNIQGIGSNASQFDANRYKAQRDFFYARAELSRTQDLPFGAQFFAKLAGQVADSPLINSEQYSLGGFGTVRGYLESEVLADNAGVVNLEFRTPSLLSWIKGMDPDKPGNELRFYAFTDWGTGGIISPLPEQTQRYSLASFGGGTRLTLLNHLNGSVDLAFPLFDQSTTKAHIAFLLFRLWADF